MYSLRADFGPYSITMEGVLKLVMAGDWEATAEGILP